MTTDQRAYWDSEAATFDDEPDHGLRDPATRAAWDALMKGLLDAGDRSLRVADLGCGTASLALLLASHGHRVHGIDLSPVMIEFARDKAVAAGTTLQLDVGDASVPDLPAGAFDVVLSRHVVWALPDPRASLTRWTDLLAPGGRMILVEGRWHTGGGLRQDELLGLLDPRLAVLDTARLDDPVLWGKEIEDERYYVMANLE